LAFTSRAEAARSPREKWTAAPGWSASPPWGALDAGCAVNPAIVEAQIVGHLVQTVSRMLFEEVTFDRTGVTSLD
jgi:hypothetical protein